MRSDLVIPWRGGPNVPLLPTNTAPNLLGQLRGALGKIKAELKSHGGAPSDAEAARMGRVYALTTPAALDVDVAATSLAMYRTIEAGLETLVKLWVSARGFPFALEALVLGLERGIVLDHDHYPPTLAFGVVPFDELHLEAPKLERLRTEALEESTKAIGIA